MKNEIKNIIKQINNKESILYFFVTDSKNTPNSIMFNVYTLAKTLQDSGFNTKMIYMSNLTEENEEFVGVSDWLGSDFSTLEYYDISTTEITFNPSDFIFIPDILYFFIDELHRYKVTSELILVSNNINNVLQSLEYGQPIDINRIKGVISFSEENTKLLKEFINFNDVEYYTMSSLISDKFTKKNLEDKELTIGICSKSETFIKSVVNTFFTLAPNYNFLSFSRLSNLPYSDYIETINNTRFIVWEDDTSISLNSLKECLSSNSIVLAKPSQYNSEIYNDQTVLWCNNPYEVATNLKSLITTSINKEDNTLQDIINDRPSYKKDFKLEVSNVINSITKNRIEKLNSLLKD